MTASSANTRPSSAVRANTYNNNNTLPSPVSCLELPPALHPLPLVVVAAPLPRPTGVAGLLLGLLVLLGLHVLGLLRLLVLLGLLVLLLGGSRPHNTEGQGGNLWFDVHVWFRGDLLVDVRLRRDLHVLVAGPGGGHGNTGQSAQDKELHVDCREAE